MFDIAVIGAGIAGLMCAQQLAEAGYSVVVVEKSRGVGGRVATRRLHGTRADHGVCYLKPKGEILGRFVQLLSDRHLLEVWTDTVYEFEPIQKQFKSTNPSPRYVAPEGMSAIAKFLATGLEIWLSQRVQALAPATNDCLWHLTLESTNTDSTAVNSKALTARALVVAIPAPQALTLLEPLTDTLLPADFLENLRSVKFDPCLSVIAGYSTQLHQKPEWKAVTFIDDPDIGWIGLDSSKRQATDLLVFVLQSSPGFAQHYLEASDLHLAGQQMLARAAECLSPLFNSPDWMQVHRWRYAFPSHPWQQNYLSTTSPLPLVCCGDWCRGNQVEGAMLSGLAAAEQINLQLQQRTLPGVNYLDFIAAKG